MGHSDARVIMSQVEARIAANSYSIRKICNEGLAGPAPGHFNQQLLIHELIRGSLDNPNRIAFVQYAGYG